MTLAPEIHGTVRIRSATRAFLRAFRQRVDSGLLSGKPHARSHYVVIEADTRQLRVRAADWWTAINVGLNELELRLLEEGLVRYQVHYWRWASYALGLCGVLGLLGLLLLVTLDVRTYIARSPTRMLPGLSVDQNLLIAWAMVLFWGFLWPWLLILLHKRPLRRLVTRHHGGRCPAPVRSGSVRAVEPGTPAVRTPCWPNLARYGIERIIVWVPAGLLPHSQEDLHASLPADLEHPVWAHRTGPSPPAPPPLARRDRGTGGAHVGFGGGAGR